MPNKDYKPKVVYVNNHGELEKAVNEGLVVARAQISGDWRKLANITEARRDECGLRGFHVVSDDSKGDETNHFSLDNLRICYHCELFFGKYDGIPYKVVPV